MREYWKYRRRVQIAARVFVGIVVVMLMLFGFSYLASGHEYTEQEQRELLVEEEPLVRGTPTDEEPVYVEPHETDAVGASRKKTDTDTLLMKLSAKGIVSSDTPEEDEADDQFELLCQIVMCEGGYTEPDDGLRAMADGVLNRMDSPLFPNTIAEVVYQKGQFEPVGSGRLWSYVPTERVIQICAEEIQHRTYPTILYWRTGHYHAGTTPIAHIGHHYYSGK
jgi:hypothetical protein